MINPGEKVTCVGKKARGGGGSEIKRAGLGKESSEFIDNLLALCREYKPVLSESGITVEICGDRMVLSYSVPLEAEGGASFRANGYAIRALECDSVRGDHTD